MYVYATSGSQCRIDGTERGPHRLDGNGNAMIQDAEAPMLDRGLCIRKMLRIWGKLANLREIDEGPYSGAYELRQPRLSFFTRCRPRILTRQQATR
jgi:hypothetical protein